MIFEKIVTYGEDNRLTGIVTQHKTRNTSNSKPGVILINAGVLHKVGPYRLYVEIARTLGNIGFPVLRFDLSGLGDSSIRTHNHNASDLEQSLEDIQDSVDLLHNSYGINSFVVIGLCSGADSAHKYIIRDPRVVGGIFLDGYGYRTWKYRLNRSIELLSAKRISNYFKRVITAFSAKKSIATADSREAVYQWSLPPKEQVESELEKLIERQANLLYIYSRGSYTYYNYHNQFRDMYKSEGITKAVNWHLFPGADHLYINIEDRKQLIQLIERWCKHTFSQSQHRKSC